MLTIGDPAPSFERRPVFGLPVQVPSKTHLLLCFVRSLSSPLTRERLAQLQERHGDFDVEGIRIAVITDSEVEVAQDFVPRYHVLSPVICDPEQALFEEWGVGGHSPVLGRLRGLGVANVRGAIRALKHGMGPIERRQLRLPAQFLIQDGRILAAHYAQSVGEDLGLDDLLATFKAANK
ncbi:MAG: peroxiredoxin [Cognaticolwellia sp.]|jgi:peroxiredoxin